MGCTPNFEKIQEVNVNTIRPRSTIKIQYLKQSTSQHKPTDPTALPLQHITTEYDSCENDQEANQLIKQKQHKIKVLQGSKNFMEISIQASTYVNQALVTLSSNPLLYDQSYPKLIGINKKTLHKKQNRFSYLAKREQKAQLQLKKQKQKVQQYSKSHPFHSNLPKISIGKPKPQNKQNMRLPSLFYTMDKQKHNLSSQRMGMLLLQSQLTMS